ncbi:MAG: SPASM domain-containing protein, partial [Acidaminococcaceae bacterium]|nr:SPASM domain-containing protein [Acidaminococcaceae bacterium]
FDEVVRWGQGYKCSVVVDYLIMARCDRSTDNLQNRLSADEVEQVVTKLLNSNVVFQTNIRNRDESKLEKHDGNERVCGVGLTSLCMIANGDVYPCVGWHKCILGNLNKNSLNDIWNNSPQIKYFRGLRLKNFKKCNGCKDYDYCLMCMSRNSNEDPNGDIFNIPQITCDAAKIHHKLVEKYRRKFQE